MTFLNCFLVNPIYNDNLEYYVSIWFIYYAGRSHVSLIKEVILYFILFNCLRVRGTTNFSFDISITFLLCGIN
jgi:hypothetical protein